MDPIADMLTRIRNANKRYHKEVSVPASKLKEELARILKEEGYIEDFKLIKEDGDGNGKGTIVLSLKYKGKRAKERVISGIERVSKPGRRVYVGAQEIPEVLNSLGITILSTSSGVMTGKQARKLGIGGEVMCNVW